jgi:hypothetical protein
MRTDRVIYAFLWLVWLLAACGGETTAVSTTAPPTAPTRLPTPIATATPTTGPTPSAIFTLEPTPEFPPTPLVTPSVDLTATPLPTPTAAPTLTGLIGPDNFPSTVNPLTGEMVGNPAVLARRPFAIKISNAPDIVRPQAGLGSADLVFEHYVEGGFTRFTAVFYSQDADPVGSIRSGRLIDLEIPRMYDAAFAYAGSSGPVRLMFKESPFFNRLFTLDFGHGGFYRVEDPDLPRVHALFTDTPTLRYLLNERGEEKPPMLQNGMTFRLETPPDGQPATGIELRYRSTNVNWAYNQGNGRYHRWTDGQPHLDANTEEQLSFKNIVVIAAHHQDTTIIEDTGGNYSIQIQIWGEGPATIFRNGQQFDGLWRRSDPNHMLTFHYPDGSPLPLAPGSTFFQIVPLGFDDLTVTP